MEDLKRQWEIIKGEYKRADWFFRILFIMLLLLILPIIIPILVLFICIVIPLYFVMMTYNLITRPFIWLFKKIFK